MLKLFHLELQLFLARLSLLHRVLSSALRPDLEREPCLNTTQILSMNPRQTQLETFLIHSKPF